MYCCCCSNWLNKTYLEYHWDPAVQLCFCPIQTQLRTEREQSCGPRLRWSLPEESLPETWGAGGTACWALPSPGPADRWCSDPTWTAGHLNGKERHGSVRQHMWMMDVQNWRGSKRTTPFVPLESAMQCWFPHITWAIRWSHSLLINLGVGGGITHIFFIYLAHISTH